MSRHRTRKRRAQGQPKPPRRLIYRKAWVVRRDTGQRLPAIETEYGFSPFNSEVQRNAAFEARFLGMAFEESEWASVERE